MKTETNRRTGTDEFTLAGEETQVGIRIMLLCLPFSSQHLLICTKSILQDYFNQFGDFLDKKISEFEGQFWNDPDWFYGGIWHEFGENEQFYH